MGAAGGSCNSAEVHPAGLPNVRVNAPRARRQKGRTQLTYVNVPLLSSRGT